MIDTPTEAESDVPDEAEAAEQGECPTCGPDQEADSDGHCSWCGRRLAMGPDPRDDPGWWRG